MVLERIPLYAVLSKYLGCAYVAATIMISTCCNAAYAASDGEWAHKPFQYVAVDQNLRDVLRELSIATSVPIKVSDLVSGQAHGRWPDTTAGEFLSQLARTYALEWYFDGSLLSVSASSEDETRLVSLHGAGLERLRDGLTTAGLMDARFTLRPGPTPDVALVSGPPRFVAVVQEAMDAIVASATVSRPLPLKTFTASAEQRVTVFRGSAATSVVFR